MENRLLLTVALREHANLPDLSDWVNGAHLDASFTPAESLRLMHGRNCILSMLLCQKRLLKLLIEGVVQLHFVSMPIYF